MMTSSVSHELITPLKCIVQLGEKAITELPDPSFIYKQEMIISTANLLLRNVKGNLDRNLMNRGTFLPNREPSNLIAVVDQTIKMLEM
jgi:hypothetical protein